MLESNRKVLKAIETGDSATIRQYISEDATDHGAGENGADMKGADIIKMLTDVHNHIDNLKFEVVQEAANGDHLFCLARMTGKVKDPVWGMPAGMQADMTSVDVIRVKDGKMVDHWNYVSPADMMKMMPPPPPPPTSAAKK
jgi:predicted SnoaL-like aldol condensation-catalyzing enzyme